jgi:hypothetical protein
MNCHRNRCPNRLRSCAARGLYPCLALAAFGALVALSGCAAEVAAELGIAVVGPGGALPIDGNFFPLSTQLTTVGQTVSIQLSSTFSGDLSTVPSNPQAAFPVPFQVNVDGGTAQSVSMAYQFGGAPQNLQVGEPGWPGSPSYSAFLAQNTFTSAVLGSGVHTITVSQPAISGFSGSLSQPIMLSVDVEPGRPATLPVPGTFLWSGAAHQTSGSDSSISVQGSLYALPPMAAQPFVSSFALPCTVSMDGAPLGALSLAFVESAVGASVFNASGTVSFPTPATGVHAIQITPAIQVNVAGTPVLPFSCSLEISTASVSLLGPLAGDFSGPTILSGPIQNGGAGMSIAVDAGNYVGTVGGTPAQPPTLDVNLVGTIADGTQVSAITVPYTWMAGTQPWSNSPHTDYYGFALGTCQGLQDGVQTLQFAAQPIPGFTGLLPDPVAFTIEVSAPVLPADNG